MEHRELIIVPFLGRKRERGREEGREKFIESLSLPHIYDDDGDGESDLGGNENMQAKGRRGFFVLLKIQSHPHTHTHTHTPQPPKWRGKFL